MAILDSVAAGSVENPDGVGGGAGGGGDAGGGGGELVR
jgi:hypothetical protein